MAFLPRVEKFPKCSHSFPCRLRALGTRGPFPAVVGCTAGAPRGAATSRPCCCWTVPGDDGGSLGIPSPPTTPWWCFWGFFSPYPDSVGCFCVGSLLLPACLPLPTLLCSGFGGITISGCQELGRKSPLLGAEHSADLGISSIGPS